MEETSSQSRRLVDLSALTTPSLAFFALDVLPRNASFCGAGMGRHVRKHVIYTNGGRKRRTVYEPSRVLYWVQKRISEGLLRRLPMPTCVTGFVAGRGSAVNAAAHVDSRVIVNIDLKDFFPSITPERVYGMYSRVFSLPSRPAAMMTRVTTYDGHLCQGFVTSPDIANVISWSLDNRLSALARACGLRYTRYADDLTFSSVDKRKSMDWLVDTVSVIAAEEGFEVNDRKIAFMRRGRRQRVTGCVVSDKHVAVDRRVRMLLKSAVRNWHGQSEGRKKQILGWISYVQSVNERHGKFLRDSLEKAASQPVEQPVKMMPDRDFSEDVAMATGRNVK